MQAKLEQLSTDFFQQLPCRDVSLIADHGAVSRREEMVNTLMDVAIGQGLLKAPGKPGEHPPRALGGSSLGGSSAEIKEERVEEEAQVHPLDEKYRRLGCSLVEVAQGSEVHAWVSRALGNTSEPALKDPLNSFHFGPGGGPGGGGPEITGIFEMRRAGEQERGEAANIEAIGNKKVGFKGIVLFFFFYLL